MKQKKEEIHLLVLWSMMKEMYGSVECYSATKAPLERLAKGFKEHLRATAQPWIAEVITVPSLKEYLEKQNAENDVQSGGHPGGKGDGGGRADAPGGVPGDAPSGAA